MKVIKLVGSIFLVVGLATLGGAGYSYFKQTDFITAAKSAQGEVVDMVRSESRNDGTTSNTYAAVVRFTDDRGVTQEFVNRVSSNPPRYSRGQTVELLYAPDNPGDAIINDFSSRWMLAAIFGGMGTLFAVLGGGMLFWLIRRARIKEWLRAKGTRLSVDFYSVDRDTSLSVNGRHPFRVVGQGKNPFTGKLEQYLSEPIWVDPTKELKGTKLRVFLDPNRPDRHTIDVDQYLVDD